MWLTLFIWDIQHFSHGLWHVQLVFLCHRLAAWEETAPINHSSHHREIISLKLLQFTDLQVKEYTVKSDAQWVIRPLMKHHWEQMRKQRRDLILVWGQSTLWVCVTYRCGGDDLLSDDPQCVYHRDVAQPPSYAQGSVTVLDKENKTNEMCVSMCVCVYACVSVDGCLRTTVIALGLAPYCSRMLMMCVLPCWAAWWRGVYPFWEGKCKKCLYYVCPIILPSGSAHPNSRKTTTTLQPSYSSFSYLRFGIDAGSILKQEVNHLGITIVTCYN